MKASSAPASQVVVVLAFALPLLAQESKVDKSSAGSTTVAATRPAKHVSDVGWYDARKLTIEGRGWTETENFFERLPAKAKGKVTDAVWGLSKNTAGMAVRFVTDAKKISARWTLTSERLDMNHMPAMGVSGLDLYVRHNGRWQWTGVGKVNAVKNEGVLADGIPAGSHEYLLYLPLYNGIRELEIGVPAAATLQPAPPRPAALAKPVCVYGTSIAQGGCASRPGMAHVAILGRRLNRPTINLGFSGAGKMEPAMAELLCELDVAFYVLDCLPNMTAEMVTERLPSFVEKLRQARPETPIVLVENTAWGNAAFLPGPAERNATKNGALRKAYEGLVSKGITKLVYVPDDNLLGADGEGTVDGGHPTDLGFIRFADALTPILRKTPED